jgi:hypothetical protein
MARRSAVLLTALVATAWAIGVPSASASVEFGDNCSAGSGLPKLTLAELSKFGSLPLDAPTGGVITKVKFNVSLTLPVAIPQTVKVLRPLSGPEFVVSQEATVNVPPGASSLDVRMPVKPGERLAVHGPLFKFGPTEVQVTFLCEPGPGEPEGVIGTSLEDSPVGGTIKFAETPTAARVPVAAVIEPDADGDGYGDETQDKCPQSAAVQTDCSPVGLDAFAVQSQGKVVVLVVATAPAKVKVAGSVKLPKGASASASTKLKPVTHELTPGKLGRFTLKFPGPLKSALGSLPKGKKLPLKITVSSTNVANVSSKVKKTLKLTGGP